jgi:hypothetical protein
MDFDSICEPLASSGPSSCHSQHCDAWSGPSSQTSTSTILQGPSSRGTLAARRSFSRALSVSPVVLPPLPPFPHQHARQLQRQSSQQPSPMEPGPDLFAAATDSATATAAPFQAVACAHDEPQSSRGCGWFCKCRGCGQLTSGELPVADQVVPFCDVCSQQLQAIPSQQRVEHEDQLLVIHRGWVKAGH